jgi:outer membrane immunogenic protein
VGYAVGQFLPNAVFGAAVGRVNYSTTTISGSNQSQDNVFPFGFVAGLGMDVLLLPNVFLRGEWGCVLFAHVGGIRSNDNTTCVGLGLQF